MQYVTCSPCVVYFFTEVMTLHDDLFDSCFTFARPIFVHCVALGLCTWSQLSNAYDSLYSYSVKLVSSLNIYVNCNKIVEVTFCLTRHPSLLPPKLAKLLLVTPMTCTLYLVSLCTEF